MTVRQLLRRFRGQAASPPPSDWRVARRVVVLEEGASPSGDYLLYPWLSQRGLPVMRCDSRKPPRSDLLQQGDFVVILRYLPSPWIKLLSQSRSQMAGMAWFMDDDLWDQAVLDGLPTTYARKIRSHALRHRAWCMQMRAQLWVSTSVLAEKYAAHEPVLLPLAPPAGLSQAQQDAVRLGYHGTASHHAELAWLHQVLAALMARSTTLHVELFGDLAINRQFRDLPRVSILHPMSWERYQHYTASHHLDIGLAPLLPTTFNQGRGAVKFYDYARMGAFGVYADVPPYRGFVHHDQDGLLLPMDAEAWVQTLLQLSQDTAMRQRLARGAGDRAIGPCEIASGHAPREGGPSAGLTMAGECPGSAE